MINRATIAVLLLLLAGLHWRLWVAEGGVAHTHRLQLQAEVQQAENARLRGRNEGLALEVQDLNSGLAAVEARARSALGMIRESETFYLVVQR